MIWSIGKYLLVAINNDRLWWCGGKTDQRLICDGTGGFPGECAWKKEKLAIRRRAKQNMHKYEIVVNLAL